MPESLRQRQLALARGLRDPAAPAPDGVDARATAVYRRLLFGNIERTLGNAFPVIRALDGDAAWYQRLRHFFAEHRLQRRELRRLPEDFIEWLETRAGRELDAPYLPELAIYEWAELAIADDSAAATASPGSFTPDAPLQLSPLAWPMSFRYPVHRIGPDERSTAAPAEPTHLLLYRDADDRVGFLQLDADAIWLVQRLQAQSFATARELLDDWAATAGLADADRLRLRQRGLDLLADLHRRQILSVARPEAEGRKSA